MIHPGSHHARPSIATVCLIGLACAALSGCSSKGVGTAAPRVQTIPLQQTAGAGGVFALDLGTYVTDRENQALTYAVVSGGGSFTGSSYSNVFDSIGSYDVQFSVTDLGKLTTGTFEVEVQTANFAVVRTGGTFLRLLDTDTEKFLEVSGSSFVETFEDGLSKGQLVFERLVGASNYDLFAYDPMMRTTYTLGDDTAAAERHAASMTDGRVVFTRTTSGDSDLLIWNPVTKLVKVLSVTEDEQDRNPLVATAGGDDELVFFERTSNSQGDVYSYDPSTDEVSAVSTDSGAEAPVAKVGTAGIVFSRRAGGGQTHLYHYSRTLGLARVGGDLGTGVDTYNATFHAATSTSQVVFSLAVSSTVRNLYVWTPSTGQSTLLANSDLEFRGISADDIVVYTVNNGSQDDVFAYDTANGSSAVTVSNNGTDETFETIVQKAGKTYVVYTRNGSPASLHVYDVDAVSTVDVTDGAGVTYRAALGNGDLVYRLADGSAVAHFDTTTGTSTSVTGSLTATSFDFAGAGTAAGDFVITATVSSQTDLHLWDHSAAGTVTVSTTTGNDVFAAMTTAGEVLFTRVAAGTTHADLHLFDPADVTTVQLTFDTAPGGAASQEILGSYAADRR